MLGQQRAQALARQGFVVGDQHLHVRHLSGWSEA
jgi:hypothetical protein